MSLAALTKTMTFYTAQDSSITSTGARDPLGFEILWSYLGREIFNNRVTSIANDARNYSLNLVHHAVVRQLKNEGTFIRIKEILEKDPDIGEIRESMVVVALLIFMENALIYSMLKGGGSADSVDLAGVLGTQKGATAPLKSLWISPRKEAFILVNQANVGLNARYKTPFIKMGFFDEAYDYDFHRSEGQDIWQQVKELDELKELQHAMVDLIRDMTTSSKKGRLEISLLEPSPKMQEVSRLYRATFGEAKIDRYPRLCKFWINALCFNQPPASYLFDAVREISSDESNQLQYRKISELAVKRAGEYGKYFSAIIDTENVLAPLRYMFDVLLSAAYSHIDHPGLAEKAEKAIDQLDQQKTAGLNFRFSGATEPAKKRIQRILREVITANNPPDFIQALLNYHYIVVAERRNVPWVREENGRLRILSGMQFREPKEIYDWYHSYYFNSLASIISGFGKQADQHG